MSSGASSSLQNEEVLNGVVDKPLYILKTYSKSALFLLSLGVHNPRCSIFDPIFEHWTPLRVCSKLLLRKSEGQCEKWTLRRDPLGTC